MKNFLSNLFEKNLLLAAVVIVGAILRYYLYVNSPMYTTDGTTGYLHPDAREYVAASSFILENGLLAYFSNEISVDLACGTPLYLALMYNIFDGNFQYIRMFGIFLSCVQIVLIYKISFKLFKNFQIAILAAIFLALNAYLANFSYTLLTETISLFCWSMFVYFYLTCKEADKNFFVCAILSAIFLWAATLIRAVSLLLPLALYIFYIAYYLWKKNSSAKFECKIWLTIGIAFYILLSPFIIKNHILFNFNNLCTGGGTALFLGSRVESYGDEPAFYGSDYGCIYKVIGANSHRAIESDRKLYAAGIETIKAHPYEYFKMNVKKIARLTTGTNFSWFNPVQKNSLIEVNESYGNQWTIKFLCIIFLYTAVFSFAVLGICRQCKNFELSGMILFPMYFLVLSLPFLAILRYGLILFIFAAIWAASEIVSICQNKQYKLFTVGLFAALVMEFYIAMGF